MNCIFLVDIIGILTLVGIYLSAKDETSAEDSYYEVVGIESSWLPESFFDMDNNGI